MSSVPSIANSPFGIHVWNIECRDGRFQIWNRERTHNETSLLANRCEVERWNAKDDRVNCLIRSRP